VNSVPLFTWLQRPQADDDDLQDEIRPHLAIAAQQKVDEGAAPDAARAAALKEFGNVTLTREAVHAVWNPPWLDAMRDQLADVRYALRVIKRSPGFSIAVMAVLALGISLNAAVFTLLKSIALNPLAGVADSASLGVVVAETSAGRQTAVSYPDYEYLRDHDHAFSGLIGSALVGVSVGEGRDVERVMAELVTGNYFQVLGVGAQLGRTLLPSDHHAAGEHPVVVLSDGLWRRAFGADPDIVGKTIRLDAYPLTVVGVADAAFHGTIVSFDIEAFVPMMMADYVGVTQERGANLLTNRRAPWVMVTGRLRPGVTLGSASAQMGVLSAQMAREDAAGDLAQAFKAIPIWQSPFGAQTYMLPAVVVMSVTGILLLLLVCANIAALVLVRGVSRRGELAVRLALGATRARLVRLLFLENLVLAVPGAALGLFAAWRGLPFLWAATSASGAPARIYLNVSIDGLVIAFSAGVAIACALVFGFVPSLQASRVDLAAAMTEDAPSRGSARATLRAGLVSVQVAMSVLLLVASALTVRSLEAARRADPGFDPERVISVAVDLKPQGYDAARGRQFYAQLIDHLEGLQGVDAVSLAAFFPMSTVDMGLQRVSIDGYEPQVNEDLRFLTNVVGPEYFRTLAIPIVAGRGFVRHDDDAAAAAAVVNATLARRFFGSEHNALGKRVRLADGEWRTVIGVAQDVKYARINEAPRPHVYAPVLQAYQPAMYVHVRGSGSLSALIARTRLAIETLDPRLPTVDAKPLAEQTGSSLTILQLMAGMLLLFGVAGMLLAATGVYGLVSYSVEQRSHEIGIRMALGARASAVVRGFVRAGMRLGLVGAAMGLVGAVVVTRLLRSVLFGVSATDLTAFGSALAVVLGSVLVATLIPAWRAARTNPLAALRHQ
jgi:macrolide transport system ATP-binding/permease protein